MKKLTLKEISADILAIVTVVFFVTGSVAMGINQSMELSQRIGMFERKGSLELESFSLDADDVTYVGYCDDKTFNTRLDIYKTVTFTNPITKAAFYAEGVSIMFKNTDIEAVAHEVSHYVDYLSIEYGFTDTETRAYLQGYYTECVARTLLQYQFDPAEELLQTNN